MPRAGNNCHPRLILPVLDFKGTSRNSGCFGEYVTEHAGFHFSTVSPAHHLLLRAAFAQSSAVAASPATDAASVGNGSARSARPYCLGSRNAEGLHARAVLADRSQDAPQTPGWKSSDLSCLPQHKLLTRTRPSILASHILNSRFPTQPCPGTRSSTQDQCPPSALIMDLWTAPCLTLPIKKGDFTKPPILLKKFLF